ncbi:hypothetical protein EVAR_102775_1 [Eumeta japonica]|uniref:Uncharacterized protein n=1 Tax=Eumeta variegata TaxID=151549 RepID=A0A4C1TLA9_EUMVA|nr:hypothetical protein EVAR_102775_1 [Eumeta japonica]
MRGISSAAPRALRPRPAAYGDCLRHNSRKQQVYERADKMSPARAPPSPRGRALSAPPTIRAIIAASRGSRCGRLAPRTYLCELHKYGTRQTPFYDPAE